jgi:hypothetical protein
MLNWKGCGRKWSWPNLRCYPDIFLEGLRKSTKKLGIVSLEADVWTQDLSNMNSSVSHWSRTFGVLKEVEKHI